MKKMFGPKAVCFNDKKGFTLVETLIYIAIIGTAVTSFVVFAISIGEPRNKTYATQEVQANMRTAVDLISQRVRAATGVNTGASTFGSDPGVLSLAMADSTKNPTLIDLTADDGILRITEGVSSAVPITSTEVQVTNLVFTNLTPSGERESIRIEMTMEYNNSSGDVEFDYTQSATTTVGVRQ